MDFTLSSDSLLLTEKSFFEAAAAGVSEVTGEGRGSKMSKASVSAAPPGRGATAVSKAVTPGFYFDGIL